MDLHKFIEEHRTGIDLTRREGGRVLLEYNDFERDTIQHIIDNQKTIIKKSRQMYMTTMLAAYTAWFLIFNEGGNKEIIYTTNKYDGSKRFKQLVDYILYDYFKDEWKNNKDIHKVSETKLKNGNSVRVTSSNVASLCGIDIRKTHMYIIDESAYVHKLEEFISAISAQALNKDLKVVLSSTPNGFEFFHQMWVDSNSEKSPFKPYDLIYWKNLRYGYDEWINQQKNMLGDMAFKQEIMAEFLSPQQSTNNKSNLLQFRVTDEIANKVGIKLIEKNITISEYLRKLVEKDIAI